MEFCGRRNGKVLPISTTRQCRSALLYGATTPAKPEGRSDCALHSGQDAPKTKGSAMRTEVARCGAIAAVLLCLPSLLFAQIQVTPVVSGLSSPLFVGHAGDGTKRLFIEERAASSRCFNRGAARQQSSSISARRLWPEASGDCSGIALHPAGTLATAAFSCSTRVPATAPLVIAEYTRFQPTSTSPIH